LPTIGIFVAIAFGAWLWGAVGALVATPTLIVAAAFVTRLNAARWERPKPLDDDLQQPETDQPMTAVASLTPRQ
jgi:predicted PurR-regulated permease PerM